MSFPAQCPNCNTKLKAEDKHVGKKLPCPKCKRPFVVKTPKREVVETAVEPSSEEPEEYGLKDPDPGNLNLGDLGIGSDLADTPPKSESSRPANLGSPRSSPSGRHVPQPQKPVRSDSQEAPGSSGMSRPPVALIVAGGVGALLLVGLTVLGVWLLGSSGDSNAKQTADSASQPTANEKQTAGAAVQPTAPGPFPADSPAQPRQEDQQAFQWHDSVKSENVAGKESYASFTSPEDGARSVSVTSSERKEFKPGAPRNHALPAGSGLPLAARPADWFTGKPIIRAIMHQTGEERLIPATRWIVDTPAEPELIISAVDGDGHSLVRLKPLESPGVPPLKEELAPDGLPRRYHHRHLWSEDGDALYVLAGADRLNHRADWTNQLFKINTHTWKVELRLSVKLPGLGGRNVSWLRGATIRDIAWSSEGLAVLLKGRMESSLVSDPNGTIWFPLMTDTRGCDSLVMLDPVTLQVKRGWAIPVLPQIAGSRRTPLIYLQYRGDYVCVVNTQTGELVNITRHEESMRRPVVTSDGKWLLTHGREGELCRFRLAGHDVIRQQSRAATGERGISVSGDGQYISFRGRDKYEAVRTDDLEKSIGSVQSESDGLMVLDPVNKTAFVCFADPADGALKMKILQGQSAVQLTLDTITEEGQQTGRAATSRSRSPAPKWKPGLWPISVSAEPTGRGAIAFVENAAFWVETRTKGEAWAFSSQKPTEVSAVEALADTRADEARLALPEPIERPFAIRAVRDDAPGRIFQLPERQYFRALDVDPRSGDIAIISAGTTKELSGTWLYVCRATDLQSDSVIPASALLFERNVPVTLRFKLFEDRTLLLVCRDDVLWVLDPQSLRLAELDDRLHNRIDLRLEQYDRWLRPPVKLRKEPDGSHTVYTSRDADDATVVLSRRQLSGNDPLHQGFRMNLESAEMTEPMTVPSPRFPNAASVAHIGAIQDPYGELVFERGRVVRDGVESKWPSSSNHPTLAVLEKRPWIVARGKTHAYFYNRSDLSEKTDVEFPRLLQGANGPPRTVACAGASPDELIFAGNPDPFENKESKWGVFWVMPLTEPILPDKPLLFSRLDLPKNLEPGRPTSIAMDVPDSRAKVVLAEGPDGAKLTDGKLTWTPKRSDIGLHEFVVRTSAGETSAERKYSCSVGFTGVQLPFGPAWARMSPAGDQLLTWTHERVTDAPQIALVNVREQEVVASRELTAPLASAVLAAGQAFLLYQDHFTLEVCSPADFRPIETLFLTQPIVELEAVEDRLLFLMTAEDRVSSSNLNNFLALELPDLRQTQLTRILSETPRSVCFNRTTNGWRVGPAVLDEQLKSITSLHSIGWSNVFCAGYAAPQSGSIEAVPSNTVRVPATISNNKREMSVAVADGAMVVTTITTELKREPKAPFPAVRLDVSFQSAEEGVEPVQIPFAVHMQGREGARVLASGEGVAIFDEGELYTFFPKDLGLEIPPAPKPADLSLRAKARLTRLTATGNTDVQFVADGGKPPYQYECEMKLSLLGFAARNPEFQEKLMTIGTENGLVTIDGSLYVDTLLTAEFHAFPDILYQFAKRRAQGSNAVEFVDLYTQEVSEALQPLVRRPLLDGQVSHDTTPPSRGPLDRLGVPIPRHRLAPAPDLPLIWNDGTQVDVASEIRRLWPRAAIDDPNWSVERLAACCTLMASEHQIVEPSRESAVPEKTWRTTEGKEVTGCLVGANKRDVYVRPAGQHRSARLALHLLDDDSLQRAWITAQGLRKKRGYSVRKKPSPGSSARVQPDVIGSAIGRFRNDYGCLPPRAIVDEAGQPLLSWRVLLLPYLGHSELFHLFHLDEPWDSEYNRKLISYMPLLYNSTQTGLPLGRTTFKTLISPQGAFPEEGLRRYHELEGDPSDALLIVEVDKSAAVEWTKPEDLDRTDDETWTEQLHKRQVDGSDYFCGMYGDSVFCLFRVNDKEE